MCPLSGDGGQGQVSGPGFELPPPRLQALAAWGSAWCDKVGLAGCSSAAETMSEHTSRKGPQRWSGGGPRLQPHQPLPHPPEGDGAHVP